MAVLKTSGFAMHCHPHGVSGRAKPLFLGRHTNVVPEMDFAFLHLDKIAKLCEIIFEVSARKGIGIAAMNVENQFMAISRL